MHFNNQDNPPKWSGPPLTLFSLRFHSLGQGRHGRPSDPTLPLPRQLSSDTLVSDSLRIVFSKEKASPLGSTRDFIACWSERMHDSFLPFSKNPSGFGTNG